VFKREGVGAALQLCCEVEKINNLLIKGKEKT
jgi:hypothetical protein